MFNCSTINDKLQLSVVLLGANPKVCVFKKLLGSKESSNLDTPKPNDEPTLSGFGIISSSAVRTNTTTKS